MKLPESFYIEENVVDIARNLLGKCLYTTFNGRTTAGIITETEAYAGIDDKASHAYGGRRTKRTEVMYWKGGTTYVYLCYGIHSLFNVVTNKEGIPHAVLIRSIQPVSGLETILARSKKSILDKNVGKGPGNVSKVLGIECKHTGLSLLSHEIWIEDTGLVLPDTDILISKRIGVDYAEEDALLPYRFMIKDHYNKV